MKAHGTVYDTRTDTEGLYTFYNLPPGRYEFAPDLPPGTTLSRYVGSDGPLGPFDLEAGARQELDIEVFASGSIQGRILDSSNRPLFHALVYIVPADERVLAKERHLYWVSQDKEGFFKFVHIPPGQYLILVNPDDSRNPDFPYGTTFYPGVQDLASAAIITIHGGEQIKDADIRLEQQFAPRVLTVRVTWADARLVPGFAFVVAKGTVNPAAMSHTSQPDIKASIIDLSILPTEPYEVEAELTCRYADEQSVGPGATLKSNKVYVEPRDDRTEIFLTIPATACPEIQGKKVITDK